ncbi:glutaminyl-peptide cyclotransferase [Phenylobacterium deserti]|nr:glutaminyl-peptide cyclotransferase [Phenylobacterium deserti]
MFASLTVRRAMRAPDLRRVRQALAATWMAVTSLALAACSQPAAALPFYGYEVKASYPHDSRAYTQGLLYLNGDLYESTGQVGRSSIRRVRLKDGAVLQMQPLPPGVFGEGLVNWGDELISFTWRDQVGYRWDLKTLKQRSTFTYPGEGWGLTQNGKELIMSDGTPFLRVLEPKTFKELRRIPVTANGKPVFNLNEIEWVKGEVWANVWQTPLIVRINPADGKVTGVIDLSGLPEAKAQDHDSVLNGIAYDAKGDRLFVTGKNWPRLYEIKLTGPVAR